MQRRGARGPSNSDAGVSGERGRRLVPPGAAPPLALGAATSWSPRCRTRRACQGLVPQERPHDPTGAGAFPANARLRRHPAVDVVALTRAALGGEAWIVEDVWPGSGRAASGASRNEGPVAVPRGCRLGCAEGTSHGIVGGVAHRGQRRTRGPPPPSHIGIAHSPLFVLLPLLADSTTDHIKTNKAEERSVST